MINRTIGATLLIIGTAIGGGMLALPVATATSGFWTSTAFLILCWLVMLIGSFLVLEVNLWLPTSTNLVSMARHTLGIPGQILAWVSFCVLLYAVLCAYTAGGSDLLTAILAGLHITIPPWIQDIIYIAILGFIVTRGVLWVDHINRGLMSIKLGSLILAVLFLIPHTNYQLLPPEHLKNISSSLMVMATSFTFSIIIPTLRTYLKGDIKQLKIAILIGSVIPLIFYILWDYIIQSTIPLSSVSSVSTVTLSKIAHQGNVVGLLTDTLSHVARSHLLSAFCHVFSAVCMLTTFLAASLSLVDFISDGIKINKHSHKGWIVYLLTYLPVLLILWIYPNLFIQALRIAGIACVVLVLLLPALMAWAGRYYIKNKLKNSLDINFTVRGGRWILVIILLSAILLILCDLISRFS